MHVPGALREGYLQHTTHAGALFVRVQVWRALTHFPAPLPRLCPFFAATEKAAYSSGIALAVAGLLIAVGTTLRKRAEARTLALTEDTPLMGGTKVVVV